MMQLIKSIAEVTKPPLRAELSMQSSCFSFVTELFILLHSAFMEGVWIPLPCIAAGSWLLTGAGVGRLWTKEFQELFIFMIHWHSYSAPLFLMNWVCQRKRGYLISCSLRGTVCLHPLSQSLKRIYHQSQQLSWFASESFSSLFGESGAGEPPPLCPLGFIHREHSAEVSRETTSCIRKQTGDLT